MNRNNFFKKTLAFIIIVLFVCVNVSTFTIAFSKNDDSTILGSSFLSLDNVIKDRVLVDDISVTCFVFQRTGIKKCVVVMSSDSFNQLYKVFVELKHLIYEHPFDDRTEFVKSQFIDQLGEKGLISKEIPSSKYCSLLNPSWFQNVRDNDIPLNNAVNGSFAKAFLCSMASEGSGWIVPPIMIPRPRFVNGWVTFNGVTSVAELYTLRGFIAEGFQIGLSLGSIGIGLSFAFPGVPPVFGFVGYSLFTTVFAENIVRYPPNNKPEVSQEQPSDGAQNIPTTLSELSFKIEDDDGDLMDYSVTTVPDIGSGGGNNKLGGVYKVSVGGLDSLTDYSWTVVVFDGKDSVERTFSFTTGADAPVVSNPNPMDNSINVPVSLSYLSFTLKDFQGDLMDYSVETSPDIGFGSGNGVDDGIYSVSIGGLNHSTNYFWFVNVSDGVHWSRKVFSFQTEMNMVFDPFVEGWHYRKQIVIDHDLVAGDLVDFPVLISTVDFDLRDKVQDDGYDILFMDGVGVASRLYHEIEFFDGSSGELVVWVNVSSLSSSVDTIFYMYYGNPSCGSQQVPEKVWNSNYKSVHHFEETEIGEKAIKDSTQYNVDFTTANMETSDFVAGKIGNAVDLDGTNEHMGLTFNSPEDYAIYSKCNTDCTSPEIMSAWIKIDTNSQESAIVGRFDDLYWNNYGTGFKYVSGNLVLMSEYNDNNPTITTTLIDTSDWHYIVGITHSSTGKIYLDGMLKATGDLDAGYIYRFIIGAQNYDGGLNHCFDGKIDEFRTSDIERNGYWISTEYNNQNNPLNFLSFGLEESSP